MRTIKFRGKNIKTGEWVYGYYAKHHFYTDKNLNPVKESIITHDIFNDEKKSGCYWTQVDGNTLGEYTGMEDNNGKEIYEGDIVTWLFFGGNWEVGKIEFKREESQFRIVNRFSTVDNRESTVSIQNKRNLKVIGNIFDNPELMKL